MCETVSMLRINHTQSKTLYFKAQRLTVDCKHTVKFKSSCGPLKILLSRNFEFELVFWISYHKVSKSVFKL